MNGEERIVPVAFAGKKLAQLKFFELVNQAIVFIRDFFFSLRAMGVVFLFSGELMKRVEIFAAQASSEPLTTFENEKLSAAMTRIGAAMNMSGDPRVAERLPEGIAA